MLEHHRAVSEAKIPEISLHVTADVTALGSCLASVSVLPVTTQLYDLSKPQKQFENKNNNNNKKNRVRSGIKLTFLVNLVTQIFQFSSVGDFSWISLFCSCKNFGHNGKLVALS